MSAQLSLFHFSSFHEMYRASSVRGPGFDSPVVPLFHWVAILGKLFTHIASPVSQLQETGVQKGSFGRLSGYGD